jgi:hypothetical protein
VRDAAETGSAESRRISAPSGAVRSTWTWPQGVTLAATALAAALAMTSAATAQEGRGHRGGGEHEADRGPDRGDERGEHARINVFISPSGEPFRAAPGQPYPVEAWFNRADANHDGVITEDEFIADATAFFRKLDTNGDGVIDGFEVDNYEQKIAPEILPHVAGLTSRDIPPLPSEDPDIQRQRQLQQAQQEQQEQDKARRRGPMYTGAAVFGLIREPEPVAAADLDFDGKITLKEMVATARRHFAELDVDHAGRIALADLPKTPVEKLDAKGRRKEHDKGRR